MTAWDAVVCAWVALVLYGMRPYRSTSETVTIEIVPNEPDDDDAEYSGGKLHDR